MIVYVNKSCIETVNTPTTARARIAAIDVIINTLVNAAEAAALNANIKEYRFDDGVTKVMFEYSDVKAISAQIQALMALQQLYLQMPGMNSRVTRLIDSKCMPNYGPYGFWVPTQM
jgi:hypothetical protein